METEILTTEDLRELGTQHMQLKSSWLEAGMPCEPITVDFIEHLDPLTRSSQTLTKIVWSYFTQFGKLIHAIDDMWKTIDKLLDQINTLKAELARTVKDGRPSLGGE